MLRRQVSATRMELLAKKAQIRLAQQGRDLLEEKRTALMREFLRVADKVMAGSDALTQAAHDARRALARAEAIDGPEAVHSAAFAAADQITLHVETSNIMGVTVPVIERKTVSRSALTRGYSLTGTSPHLDEAAAAFETEVDLIIELADSELCLRRLAGEIQRTTRRVNALDNILIPRLIAERDYIQMALDERERADHFRLKKVKQTIQRRRRPIYSEVTASAS